jgi:hypothetical protein
MATATQRFYPSHRPRRAVRYRFPKNPCSAKIRIAGFISGILTAMRSGGCGTAFKLTPPISGGNWTETILHAFTGGSDGGEPWGGLLLGRNGAVYGTAEIGGSGSGVVFGVAP